jgi:heterodisulfide reductase subunit A-like polyferredoxin
MGEVVVVGAGVAGIQAALDLANHGITVHLVEREPTIGGHMAQLDKTFPTNDCSMCILSPKMMDVLRHPRIKLYTCAEVTGIEGDVGNFTVTIRKNPRYVDEELCNGCGDCIRICPVEVYNRFDAGMGVRKAIYKPHQQAVPDIVIKDQEHCIECGLCYDACDRGAIKKEDQAREFSLTVASVVITTGYQIFDATKKEQFRYLRNPDVVTSLEFERANGRGDQKAFKRQVSPECGLRAVRRFPGYSARPALLFGSVLHVCHEERHADPGETPRDRSDHPLHGYQGLWKRIRGVFRTGQGAGGQVPQGDARRGLDG